MAAGLAASGGVAGIGTAHSQQPTGVLRGIVLRDSTNSPVVDVDITIDGTKSVRSSTAGEFVVAGLGVGPHVVHIRRVGFVPLTDTVRVTGTGPLERTFRLAASPVDLARVVVTARERLRNVALAEFEERRKYGMGKFLTPDSWKGRESLPLETVLDGVSGLVIERHAPVSKRSGCRMNVWIDGVRQMERFVRLDEIPAWQVLGVEVYRGPAETPVQFSGTGGQCGAMVIWTGTR
jgi:hypothetical protein